MPADDEQVLWPPASVRGVGGARAERNAQWTEEDLVRLHGHLLEKSLHDLFDARVSLATRREILAWLRAPKEPSGAFSYRACCALFGLDPEVIRASVLERYRHSPHAQRRPNPAPPNQGTG